MAIHGTTFPNVFKTKLMLVSGIIMALETTVLKEVHLRFGPLEAKQRPLLIKPKPKFP